MQGSVFGEPLDGGEPRAVGLHGEDVAGFDGASVHMDRAGAALGGIAADMRAGKAQCIADEMD